MPLRTYKPTSPGLRQMTRSTFEEITTKEPHKPLLEPQTRGSGRNNQGRLTVRHRGGGEKQHYRRIDFKRDKFGVPARVATIEYDPNRSARIGLLHYRDGEKRYMLLPHGLKVGDVVVAGPDAEARVGNALPLANIPLGTTIHNIELTPGKGGQIVRSAGTSAQLLAKEGDYATVRMPSGEMRRIPMRCMATVGQVSNLDHENQNLGKAGRARHLGQRPEVRGVVMNPRDHPHGGGEGKSPTGMPPKTPWGKPAMGYRTRRSKTTGRSDRPIAASQVAGEVGVNVPFRQEGPVHRGPPPRPHRGDEQAQREEGRQDLVPRVRHLPDVHRSHHRRLQRQEARPGLRDREHGRPSSW